MRITDFDIYKDLLKEKSGLIIAPEKSTLLVSRLGPIAKKWGYLSLESMTLALRGVPNKKLVYDIVEAMSYGDTSFFRDDEPFDFVRHVLMMHFSKRKSAKKHIRIWCAGSSSGQEPYSICIAAKESQVNIKLDILATDLSNQILDMARDGVYSQVEAQRGMPVQLLLKYFTPINPNKWKLIDDVRKMVRHEYFNLMESPSKLGMFDIIFCRNVLSYFEKDTQKFVLKNLVNQLENDGFLFLGKDETAVGITPLLKPVTGTMGLFIHAESDFQRLLAPG